MAKFDTTKIPGYNDELTADEKLALLLGVDIPDSHDGYIKKDTFDATASELAKIRKQYKEKLTDEERKQAEREEAARLKDERIKELENKANKSAYSAKLIAQGYSEELALDTADALIRGDMTAVLENQVKYTEILKSNVKTELLKQTATPPAGETNEKAGNKPDVSKMSYDELATFMEQNPDTKI